MTFDLDLDSDLGLTIIKKHEKTSIFKRFLRVMNKYFSNMQKSHFSSDFGTQALAEIMLKMIDE